MLHNGQLLIAKGDQPLYLQLSKANRHGVINGATGTGKTITIFDILIMDVVRII